MNFFWYFILYVLCAKNTVKGCLELIRAAPRQKNTRAAGGYTRDINNGTRLPSRVLAQIPAGVRIPASICCLVMAVSYTHLTLPTKA